MQGRRRGGTGTEAAERGREATEPQAEVARILQRSVMRLARSLRRDDADGLSPTLASSLFTIAREGPLSLGELAQREQLTKPSITTVAEKLSGLRLVERRPDPRDGRVVLVAATPAGRRRLDLRRARRTATLAGRLARLSPRDLRTLASAAAIMDRLTEDAEADRA